MDYSLPGSSVHGILQARILKWVTMPFSKGSSQPRDRTQESNLRLLHLLHWQMCSLPPVPPGKPWIFNSVQLFSHVWLFVTPWTAARQAFLSITNFWSLLRLMSIEFMMQSNHLILCHPLLPPSVIPSIRVFSNESVCIRWPKYVGSPCSPRDSHESSPTPEFKSIHSLALSFLYSSTLTSIHDYWKNHSFD